MHTAYKFRLYPNADQTRELVAQLETLRQVYNAALAYRRDLFAEEKRSPKASELYRVFSALRNAQSADAKNGGPGPHWLTRVSAVSLRDTLHRLDRAFQHFFRRVKDKSAVPGFPRFKRYGRLTSVPFENYNNGCVLRDRDGRSLTGDVPAARRGCRTDLFGVGRVKVLVHRPVAGTIKTASVVREPDGRWYAVLTAEHATPAPAASTNPPVGIDLGLEHFLTTSDGRHEPNPRVLKTRLQKLRRAQRSASRKAESAKKRKAKFRECRNLQKCWVKVARVHTRVRNLRKEHHHQRANRLVHEYGTICVESLNVRGMVRNGKLSRAIHDAGWSGFVTTLKSKAVKAGVCVVDVDPAGTSQTCPECGGEVRKSLRDRRHDCPHCGYSTHRDHAAARVILARGIGSHPPGRGGAGLNRKGSSAGVPRTPDRTRNRPPPRDPPANRGVKRSKKTDRSQTDPQPYVTGDG